MAAFDPDAYLAQRPAAAPAGPAAFDPDAYLRSREVPQVSATGRVVQDAIPAPRKRGFVEEFIAPIVEVPATIATAIPAALAGQVAGAYRTLTGGKFGTQAGIQEGQQLAADISRRLTYKPASETSQEMLAGIGEIAEVTKAAPIMPGMGAPGAIRAGARAVMDPIRAENALIKESVNALTSASAAKAAEKRMAQAYERGPQIDAAKEANRLGIALDPAISNPTRANKLRALVADPTEVHNVLSEMNMPKYNQIAKREMGISERTPLTSSKPFDEARANVAKTSYSKIEELEKLTAPQDAIARVKNIFEEGLIGSTTAENQVKSLVDDAIARMEKGLTGKQVLDNISNLRRKAQRVYNSPAAMPDQIDVADARMAIANALEDVIENNITDPKLLKDFRNARVEMAKIYGYERATDFRTGKVDIQKIAKQLEKNPAMTGDIAALGRVAANFPEVTQMKPTELSLMQRFTRAGAAGTVGAGLGGAVAAGPGVILGGALGAMTGKLGGRYASRKLGKPEVQAKRAIPKDFRKNNLME